jgi:glycosyltransferase 2 family protein
VSPRLQWIVRLVASAVLLAVLFQIVPWSEVRTHASRLPFGIWLTVLALFLAGHQLGVVKWRALVNACRARVAMRDATRAYFAGLFANLYLPSIVGGDVLRGALIGRGSGRPEAAVLGGIADRLLDIATMGMLIAFGILVAREAIPGAGGEAATALVLVAAGAAALFLPLAVRRPIRSWPRRLRRPIGRILVALRRLARSPGSAVVALVLSLVIQALFVLLNAWIGRAIGIDVSLGVWFIAWPLAKLAALLPVSIGGLVVREAALAGVLAQFGVPVALGAVAGLLWQTVNFSGGLLGGVIWWALGVRPRDATEPSTAAHSVAARQNGYA